LHHAIKAEYFRIGHMGLSVTDLTRGHLEQTINAVEQGLIECGYTNFERGAPVKALQHVLTSQ
jgi:aspartate aminotransferase-like enzyme